MNSILAIACSLSALLFSCTKNIEPQTSPEQGVVDALLEVPNATVDKSVLHYNPQTSLWTLDGQSYSGHAQCYYPDCSLKEELGILNGKKENRTRFWNADGKLKQMDHYHNGKLHGEKKVWSPQGFLLSHLNYQSGKPHGEQKTWYPTGELHKKLNLNQGREEGLQQAFRKNGALYANYEAKEGRIFGMKKASLCIGLEDEILQYGK